MNFLKSPGRLDALGTLVRANIARKGLSQRNRSICATRLALMWIAAMNDIISSHGL